MSYECKVLLLWHHIHWLFLHYCTGKLVHRWSLSKNNNCYYWANLYINMASCHFQCINKIQLWKQFVSLKQVNISLLYTKFTYLRIISKCFAGLATNFLVVFGAMDEPLASCLMTHVNVLFLSDTQACKTGMLEWNFLLIFAFHHILYMIPIVPIIFPVKFFLWNIFLDKEILLLHSLDIVSTLPYYPFDTHWYTFELEWTFLDFE